MKNIITITALACSMFLLTACGGDRSAQNGKGDTVDSNLGKMGDSGNIDTGKMTAPDRSASGGTDSVKKDTAQQH
jgi:hypothetical protein